MRRFRRRFTIGFIGILAVLGTLTATGSGAAPTCNLANLQLRDATINQGLGSYDKLVRGKETLVRMYFSMPSCHDNNDSIQITGGTLSASNGGASLTSGIVGTPSPVSTYPTASTYAAAPLNDAPADVKFVVPGSALAPASTPNAYTASFSASITFRWKSTATGPVTEVTLPFNGFRAKTVEKRTNALRVLVVPMGNAANPYASEFPSEAVAAVENGMQNLSRIFPVPSGVSTLGADSGGIRYAIDSTLLNVATPFCGGDASFATIKAQLAQFLVSWNASNPTAQADRVMGAIWSGRSTGSAGGCAEGMASLISPEGWVRAIPDAAGAPSMTGALLAMEIGHTFGLVPAARSFSTFHSLNLAADGSAPNRGYNVALRSFLSDDRSAMRLAGTWNNNTTLLEKEDYAYLLCALGGATTTECTASGVAGTAGGVAALPQSFAVTGTTDDTLDGTEVEESFRSGNLPQSGVDAGSAYRLVQLAPNGNVLQTDKIRVAFAQTVHADDEPESQTGQDSNTGAFAAVVPLSEAAVKFELRKVLPGSELVLWSTLKTRPPEITPGSFSVTPGARNFTNTFNQGENEPSLTSDANWIAYTAGQGITIAPTDAPQSAISIPFPPDQDGSNGSIVYSETNKIHVISTPTGTPVDTVEYDGTEDGLIGISEPEFSPDLTRIVFAAFKDGNQDIYSIGRFGGTLRRVTTDAAADTKPTWSAQGLIVFVRNADLFSIRPDGSGESSLLDDEFDDDEPTTSPDGKDIAWQRVDEGGGFEIYRMPLIGGGDMINVTSANVGTALRPDWSPDGEEIAYDGRVGGGQFDVFRISAEGGGTPINVTTGTPEDEIYAKWSGDGASILYRKGSGFEMTTYPSFEGEPFTTALSIAGASDWALVHPSLSSPAWGGQIGGNAHLAYVSGGNLFVLPVDLSQDAPSFGDPVEIWSNSSDGRTNVAFSPTISNDDFTVAFLVEEFEDDIFYSPVDEPDGYSFMGDGDGTGPYQRVSFSHGGFDGDSLAVQIPAFGGLPEIWTSAVIPSDPTVDFGSAPVVTEGYSPSYGTDGRITFGRDNDIWAWTPPTLGEGPGTEEKAFDNGSTPALAGETFAFARQRPLQLDEEFAPNDIWIGTPGRGIGIDVDVTDPDTPAGDLRLDLLVDCGDLVYVGAVALVPDEVDGSSASWQANYDPSLTCANPTLQVAVSDGYNRVFTGQSDMIPTEAKPPTAAIYTPVDESVFLQYQLIPARGAGWDAEDGTIPAADLDWKLEGPGGFVATQLGQSGVSQVDYSPPAGGFPVSLAPNDYTLTLTVEDSDGNVVTETRKLTVLADADNDGLSAEEEAQTCIGFLPELGSAENDPLNAFRDDDNDGIVNLEDEDACEPADVYAATLDWDADAIESKSQGGLTARIAIQYRDEQQVASAWIKSIKGINVESLGIDATQLTVGKGGTQLSARFERPAIRAAFLAKGIPFNSVVRIVVTGADANDDWVFEGSDTLLVK